MIDKKIQLLITIENIDNLVKNFNLVKPLLEDFHWSPGMTTVECKVWSLDDSSDTFTNSSLRLAQLLQTQSELMTQVQEMFNILEQELLRRGSPNLKKRELVEHLLTVWSAKVC